MTPTDLWAALLAGCDRAEQVDRDATAAPWWQEPGRLRAAPALTLGVTRQESDTVLIVAARNAWPVVVQGWRDILDEHRPVRAFGHESCGDDCDVFECDGQLPGFGCDWPCPEIRHVAAAQHAAGLLPAEVQTALREAGMLA